MKAKVIEIKNDIIHDILSEIDCEFERNGGEVPRFITDFLFEIDEIIYKPTLEEVKKEWEEEDYRMYINAREFTMFDNENIISLYKDDILIFNIYVDERMYTCRIVEIPLEIHQLLTKTFRALGWEV